MAGPRSNPLHNWHHIPPQLELGQWFSQAGMSPLPRPSKSLRFCQLVLYFLHPEKMGFGASFLNIMHALYSTPSAQVRLQGFYTESIPISKGTRQGCPLSPLIFAIAIETLVVTIRNNPDIHGIHCGSRCQKCALFADDILLFISSP